MTDYDFKQLSDYDFELFVQDALQIMLGIQIEGFKKGKDGGIDLRFISDSRNEIIIQCKHYSNSNFSNLVSKVKGEISKIQKLNPTRYILATSLRLTPTNKKKLLYILSPYCRNEKDIIGCEDLNKILRHNPTLERKNIKLWLTSAAVLDNILHNAVYQNSEEEISHILRKVNLYVQNKSFFEGKKILEKHKICIISGIPGIGKTTLAEMLILDSIGSDYEIIKVVSNINEAREVIHWEKKQLIYYDDFLGQTSLDLMFGKNEESNLLRLFESIEHHPNTRIILTTREYILNKAKQVNDPFSRFNIKHLSCLLDLEKYSKLDRAHILYNHIYFSRIPKSQKLLFLEDNNYLKIIHHKNYNPRIVEYLMKMDISDQMGSDIVEVFLDKLDNPESIWEHAINQQIDRKSRDLLLLLSALPSKIIDSDLFKTNEKYQEINYKTQYPPKEFNEGLRVLEGTFLSITLLNDKSQSRIIQFQNPSIIDYLRNYLQNNFFELVMIFKAIVFFEQIENILNYLIIPQENNEKIHDLFVSKDINLTQRIFDLLEEPSCLLDYSFEERAFEKTAKIPLQNRLIFILSILENVNSVNKYPIIIELIKRLPDLLSNYSVETNKCVDIAILLKKNIDDEDQFTNVILGIKSHILNNLFFLEDYDAFINFNETFPTIILDSEFSEIKTTYLVNIHYFFDNIEDQSDPEILDSDLELFRKVNDYFKIIMESEEIRVQERIDEINSKIPDISDYDEDYHNERDTDSSDDYSMIESMFLCLNEEE